jgi:hypothetical protein
MDASRLQDSAATFPGLGSVRQLRAKLKSQLGFDPFDPDALAEAGLEPARGLAVGIEPSHDPGESYTPVVILPVRDAAALEATVARLAQRRLGATRRSESRQGDLRVIAFRAEEEPDLSPVVALAFRDADRTAALAADFGDVPAVTNALSRVPAESLGESRWWRELRGALGDRYPVLAAVSPGSPLPGLAGRGALLGASAETDLLRLGLAFQLGTGDSALRDVTPGASKPALGALSPGAPLVLRWDGDPSALGRLIVPALPEPERRRLARRGLDLQRDLFDLFAPGLAASVSLSPRVELRELSPAAAWFDPLRVIRFELVGEVKDEARAREALDRLTKLSGDLAWRLDGKRLLVAGGEPGALEALASRKGPGFTAPTKASAAALEGGLGGAVLLPRALVAGVRALPDEAFGDDPSGFIVRTLVASTLAPLERLQAVSARAELRETALVISVELEAAPPAKKKEAR